MFAAIHMFVYNMTEALYAWYLTVSSNMLKMLLFRILHNGLAFLNTINVIISLQSKEDMLFLFEFTFTVFSGMWTKRSNSFTTISLPMKMYHLNKLKLLDIQDFENLVANSSKGQRNWNCCLLFQNVWRSWVCWSRHTASTFVSLPRPRLSKPSPVRSGIEISLSGLRRWTPRAARTRSWATAYTSSLASWVLRFWLMSKAA